MADDLLDKEQNPGQTGWENTRDRKSTPGTTADNVAAPSSNIDAASAAEKNPASARSQTSTSSQASSSESNKKGLGPQLLSKKVTPFYALVGLFLLSFGALLVMQMPGLVGIMAVNSIMNNLYDSLNSAEIRAGHKFSAKMSNKPLKGCEKLKSVRCNYKTHSKAQLDKLKKAGFEVSPKHQKPGINGRTRVQSLSYIDANGAKQTVTAKEFNKMYKKDPHFRSMVNTAYNPRWAMLRDSAAQKIHAKLKINFERVLGGSKNQMKNEMNNIIKNGDSGGRVARTTAGPVDADQPEATPAQQQEASDAKSELNSKTSGMKNLVGTGLRSANIVTGTHASVCMLLGVVNTVSTMSRLHTYAQSIQLYTLMANIAHSQVYGEATPEAVSFMGDFLTSRDMNEKAFSEESVTDNGKSLVETLSSKDDQQIVDSSQLTPNPHYGKSPMDSAGMIAATTGTPPSLDMRESQYSLGGGIAGSMQEVVKAIRDKVPFTDKKACAIWENPVVQFGGLAISAAAIIASGGTVAAAQAARAAGTIGLVYFATKYVTARLSDIMSGAQYNADLQSVDAGNALYSGGAAFYSTMASGRGLNPISTESGVTNLMAMQQETLASYERVARYEAKSEPLNAYNQYSFLGSIVWSMKPASLQSLSRTALAIQTPSIIFGGLKSLISPTASASVLSDPARFQQCQDPAYVGGTFSDSSNINLPTADFMCHIRYGNDPIHLNADPTRVIDFMSDSGQIDPISGEAYTDAAGMQKAIETPRSSNAEEVGFTEGAAPAPYTITPQEGGINPQGLGAFNDTTSLASLSVSDILRPTDETLADMGIPLTTPSDKLITYTPGYSAVKLSSTAADIAKNKELTGNDINYLPPPVSKPFGKITPGENYTPTSDDLKDYDPVKDVRTYAHWLRFCRYGDEEGRTVQLGDADGLETEGVAEKLLAGLTIDEYASDGRECLESNTCKPGDDPNGTNWSSRSSARETGDAMKNRCRPPVYDIYSIHHIDQSIENGMDEEEEMAEQAAGGDFTGEMDWPLGPGSTITSCFAPRGGSFHGALDIAGPDGTDIKAIGGGEVVHVSHNQQPFTGFGENVVIKHKDDLFSRYSHMQTGSIKVKVGDRVDKGTVLGAQGNTGQSFGSHLDIGISSNDMVHNGPPAVNPLKYLKIPPDVTNQAGCSENDDR